MIAEGRIAESPLAEFSIFRLKVNFLAQPLAYARGVALILMRAAPSCAPSSRHLKFNVSLQRINLSAVFRMAIDRITVRGARQHNLKNINVEIPRNRLTVITGLSGSGKSSLAFDTIYAEGQRRYVESLSAYARQFLDQLEKPDVDSVEGLSPAISIEQKTTSRSPRSTVGTVTEIYDYLRLLFSSVGQPHCHICGAADLAPIHRADRSEHAWHCPKASA